MAQDAGSTNSSQEDVLGQKIAELQRSPIWNAPGIEPAPSAPSFDSNAAYNQLAEAFSAPQRNGYSSAPVVLLAANNVTEPGQPVVMSDAGGGSGMSVSISGVGWRPSTVMSKLEDGTPVFESTDPNEQQLLIQGDGMGARLADHSRLPLRGKRLAAALAVSRPRMMPRSMPAPTTGSTRSAMP